VSDPGSSVAERIAPALAPLVVPIDSLTTHPRNPRQGDVGAISESLRVFGQQKPIVAQRSADGRHVIIAGNHLSLAARDLRWESIACVLVDLDDATATRFMLADNRTSQLGTFDQNVLGEVLRELAAADLLEATGYDGDDVDAILRKIAAPQDFVDFTATESDFRCPSCGYEWTGQAK
jgi:ParB-like chromosome segregation protein Spo0J